ncbi:hypothetical protein [Actinacidiphila glaucinigra]|uniref:hypothetical protein n=1 Tax=Actinacidiphila glaucinigra TaxID=235986 RepID=UPI003715FCA8
MSPELDEWNRGEAGHRFDIPVLVQRPVGAASPLRTFTTEVSHDEGRTWHPAEVKGSGVKRTVTVDHPRRFSGGSVGLRTHVEDAAGNSSRETVIKAYLLQGLRVALQPRCEGHLRRDHRVRAGALLHRVRQPPASRASSRAPTAGGPSGDRFPHHDRPRTTSVAAGNRDRRAGTGRRTGRCVRVGAWPID